MILLSAKPPALPLPVLYKISPVFKCLCWRELCRCWLAMRYKIALQSLPANSQTEASACWQRNLKAAAAGGTPLSDPPHNQHCRPCLSNDFWIPDECAKLRRGVLAG